MVHIDTFFGLIKKYNLKIDGKHIIYDGKNKSVVCRELFEALGDKRVGDPHFRLKRRRCCLVKGCVSPQCHDFTPWGTPKDSYLDPSDYEDLSEDFSVERYYAVGEKDYMNEYNSRIPEGLRLNLADFRALVRYCVGKEK